MSNYVLLDSGFANKNKTGTQETRSNSGNALNLDVRDIAWDRTTGTNNNANPGRYENTEVNYVSFNNPRLVVQGVLDKASADYNNDFAALDDMCTTKGLKLFYYNSTTDGYKPVTAVKGVTSAGNQQVDGTTKFLLVRVTSFRINEANNNAMKGLQRYTINLELTNPNN